MTGYIDIAKIQSRKSELEAELNKLNSLLDLIDKFSEHFSKPAPVPLPPAPLTQHYQAFAVPNPKIEKSRGFTPGLRRAVTMALYTGPLTMEALQSAHCACQG